MSFIGLIYGLDVFLFRVINQYLSCDMLDWLVFFVSDKYFLYLVILVSAIYLYRRYGPRSLIVVMAAITVVVLADNIGLRVLRPIFARARPCLIPEASAIPLLGRNTSYSMPSLHASGAFGFAALVWLYYRGYGWVLAAIASLIAFSRVYGGVHWPGDILAGAALGCIVAGFIYAIVELILYIIRRMTGKAALLRNVPIR
jgi:undecaprenyl-diphosphatase